MSTPTIVTLCEMCRRHYEESGFHLKPYPGKPTTAMKPSCEYCHRRYRDGLKQYLVTVKGGRK